MLPYLFEVSLGGLSQQIESHKVLFFGQFLELLLNLAKTDLFLKRKHRTPSIFTAAILTSHLIKYLADLYAIFKDR